MNRPKLLSFNITAEIISVKTSESLNVKTQTYFGTNQILFRSIRMKISIFRIAYDQQKNRLLRLKISGHTKNRSRTHPLFLFTCATSFLRCFSTLRIRILHVILFYQTQKNCQPH